MIPDFDNVSQRAWKYYEAYGQTNGVGYTKLNNFGHVDANGVDAISVYFQELHPNVKLDTIPDTFEGWPVKIQVIGEIVAL